MSETSVTVKFLARGHRAGHFERWIRQFPGNRPVWGHCRFVFDREARGYDWLVVYDDLPRAEPGGSDGEVLACPRGRTILLTTEPSSIRTYGSDFLRQFGIVVTPQEPWALSHPNQVRSHAGAHWFYGLSEAAVRTYDEMQSAAPPPKTRLLSTVCSSKKQRHTLHFDRYAFTQRLAAALPELEVFGHGVRPLDDKAEALDPYRYHVAVENHVCPDHWTEKLADALLGFTLPFYHGCPNAADYFPPECFIPIDIRDFDAARALIREAIASGQYEKRLPAIVEGRRRVLEEHNLFALLHRVIRDRDSGPGGQGAGTRVYRQHTLWRHRPSAGPRLVLEKARARLHGFRRRARAQAQVPG
jgi:hypothetical protein